MKAYLNRRYEGTMIGFAIRRTIGKGKNNVGENALPIYTYRVRRGNGHAGTKKGEFIQDKYPYFVPSSINNPEGEPSRIKFAAAVQAWKELPGIAKEIWNTKAEQERLNCPGRNLYIKYFMTDKL